MEKNDSPNNGTLRLKSPIAISHAPISDTTKGRRNARRNRLKIPGKRGGRHLSETPVGKQVIADFVKPVVERLRGRIDPPGRLAEMLKALPPEELAQAIVTPLLHGVFTVWRDEQKSKKGKSSPARQNLCITVGEYVHALLVRHKLLTDGDVPDRRKLLASLSKRPHRVRRKKGDLPGKRGRKRNADARDLAFAEWDRRDLAQVGDWLIEQAMALPCFAWDRSRKPHLPVLAPDWMRPEALKRILAIKRHFASLDDQQLPDFKPIRPWSAPVRGNLSFVGTYRRDVRDAITKAFVPKPFCLVDGCEERPPADPADFEHARGVSVLETVRYKLDPFMVGLAEALRPGLLDREMDRKKRKPARARDRRNRHNMLREDIEFARIIGSRHFRMRHRLRFPRPRLSGALFEHAA